MKHEKTANWKQWVCVATSSLHYNIANAYRDSKHTSAEFY